MPKFVSTDRLAHLERIENAAQVLAGDSVNLEELSDAEAIRAALAPEAAEPSEAALQAAADSACDALFSEQGIQLQEGESHEDALAALVGRATAAEGFTASLSAGLTAAGIELPEATEEAPLTAESITAAIASGVETLAQKKLVGLAARAGIDLDEVPETDEGDAEPKSGTEILAKYNSLKGEARTAYFAEHSAVILEAQRSA